MTDQNDPTRPPHPDGGWSTLIRSVPDAVVAPITEGYLAHKAGVFDADRLFVLEAVLWRGRPLLTPPPLPQAVDHLPGRWIWGGVLARHFGHFLTESTGRLWALDAIKGKVDGIVFIAENDFSQDVLDPDSLLNVFIGLLGFDIAIKVLTTPTRIDLLEVPGQGFGIGSVMVGTEPFRNFVHKRFARDVAPDGPERLYISRSRLSQKRGGILDEGRLEQGLYDCGYEIFHPQDHSLQVQIARYKAARQIVALDGSALHLVGLLSPPDQRVAIINRRNSSSANGIARHVAGFGHHPPLVINAITHLWIRADLDRGNINAFHEVDYGAVSVALRDVEFIPAAAKWNALTHEEAAAEIQLVETLVRGKKWTYRRVPLEAPRPPAPPQEKAVRLPPPPETKHEKRTRRAARRAKREAKHKDPA